MVVVHFPKTLIISSRGPAGRKLSSKMGSNKIFDDIRLMLIGDQNENHQKNIVQQNGFKMRVTKKRLLGINYFLEIRVVLS